MDVGSPDGDQDDRRWYPSKDRVEWEHTTREAIFESVKRCIGRAISYPDEPDSLDIMCAEVKTCVSVYARGLYALGQTEDQVVGLVFAAAKKASASDDVHPDLVAALEVWCRKKHLENHQASD